LSPLITFPFADNFFPFDLPDELVSDSEFTTTTTTATLVSGSVNQINPNANNGMIDPVLNSNNQPQSQQIKQQIQFKIINSSQQQQQVHHTAYNMPQQNIANSPNRKAMFQAGERPCNVTNQFGIFLGNNMPQQMQMNTTGLHLQQQQTYQPQKVILGQQQQMSFNPIQQQQQANGMGKNW